MRLHILDELMHQGLVFAVLQSLCEKLPCLGLVSLQQLTRVVVDDESGKVCLAALLELTIPEEQAERSVQHVCSLLLSVR